MFLSISNQREMWGLDFRRNDEIVKTAYGQYSTEVFTQEAVDIINTHNTSEVRSSHLIIA